MIDLLVDSKEFKIKPNGSEISNITERLKSNPLTVSVNTIEELANSICILGKSFSPAVYSAGERLKENAENFKFIQVLGLDFDNLKSFGLSFEDLKSIFKKLWSILKNM